MFDSQSWKSRPDHAVCSVETGLHMIKAIKDVRHNTHASFVTDNKYTVLRCANDYFRNIGRFRYANRNS